MTARHALLLGLVAGCSTATASEPAKAHVDFATQIRPVLEKRCQPCHFTGGIMYARMPFDRAGTIYMLGDKLFTRIRDDNERVMLRAFLGQKP